MPSKKQIETKTELLMIFTPELDMLGNIFPISYRTNLTVTRV